MISTRWLEKRKPHWDRLEKIIGQAGGTGLQTLAYRELQEFGLLYRQVAADLATVREDPSGERLTGYLNQLMGRAHNLIYMGRRSKPSGIGRFYTTIFPQVFRSTFNYTLAAFVVFIAAAVAGFLACIGDPSFQRYFLGGPMSDSIERRKMWTESIVTIRPLASSAIMTNNISVSFTTFALGITGGVGTVYMMLMNGLMLGVISAACWQAGMGRSLAEFVMPHGVLELPSIFIAGGGGLLIARALLFPGAIPRRDALVLYGGQGVRLALGIVPILIVAGIIEGFLSPSHLPGPAKFAFAAAVAGLFILYLTRAGRSPSGQQGS
jgi:uncharacterized membrane protein SpoIIM required for sporulation